MRRRSAEANDMSIFETLQDRVSVEQITGGRPGKKILCPAHADGNTPNLHLFREHVHCFACGFHGDVVALWQEMQGFGRPIEAALDLAREFGVEVPEQSLQARKEAEERRRKEETYLKQARARHLALDTHQNVREWWKKRGFGEDVQRLFMLGANRDGTQAVIPFWHRGRVKGLIRRKLEGEPKYLYGKREEFPEATSHPLFPARSGTTRSSWRA
jgi:DNA primase